jgi:4'-phosphopantetheinyl transferase
MTAHNHVWLPPPPDLTLSRDEVHVWQADLDPPASRLQQLAQTLSADEHSRAKRFYFEQHRQRFIAGRGILRTILGRYLGIEPRQLQFCYGPRGKPALAETSGGSILQFNLSHSQGLALYAVTRDRQIGIDLECIRSISDVEQIAKRFFSAREYAVISELPPNQKQEAFFRCWTCKEAYLKATGEGLAQLDRIEVLLTPGEPVTLLNVTGDLHTAQGWVLQELTPASGYLAALAVAGQGWHLSCWQFSDW